MLFSPITLPESTPTPEAPTPEAPKTPGPEVQPTLTDQAKVLLEAINQDRVDREARAKSEAERETFQKRAAEAESKLAALEKAKRNRMLDPATYFRSMGYTDQEMALTAEGIMFSLMPDKAPADHRVKLVEAQMLLERQENEAKAAKAQEDAQAQARAADVAKEQQIESQMLQSYKAGVSSLPAGAYPASQAWFGQDHDTYAKELLTTAREVAEAALRAGTQYQLDLRPTGVAKALEAKYAVRFARMPGFGTAPAAEPTPTPKATQAIAPAGETSVTRPSDRELIARAVAAAFPR